MHRATCAVHGHKIDIPGFTSVRGTISAGRGTIQAAPRSGDLRRVDPRRRVIFNKRVHVTQLSGTVVHRRCAITTVVSMRAVAVIAVHRCPTRSLLRDVIHEMVCVERRAKAADSEHQSEKDEYAEGILHQRSASFFAP